MKEIKTLYIIGNGFDLHHDIPSSYYDYMHWLKCIYPELAEEIERTFEGANQDSWWSDFECHLAKVDCAYDISILIYPDFEVDGIQLKGTNSPDRLAALYKAIQKTFTMWVSGLNDSLPAVHPDLHLDSDAAFLTFNYTDTLQEVYHIPDSQILHIHGNVRRGEEVIIGHNSTGEYYPEKQYEMVDFKNAPFDVAKEITAFRKPTTKIIETHRKWFESLKEVEQITVCGFSFSDVDKPYVQEILRSVSKGSKWIIYIHSLWDFMHMTDKCEELLIDYDFMDW